MNEALSNSSLRARARLLPIVILAVGLGGCQVGERLEDLAQGGPQLSEITNPQSRPDYKPIHLPMPQPQIVEDNPNSLWRAGAKAFFKDIRAKEVGDTLTVRLQLDDSAKMENKTERKRDDGEKMELGAMLGFEQQLGAVLPRGYNKGGALMDFGTKHGTQGDGAIDRKEEIELTLAALVTQVLPNGSLVILGRQEIRVNSELRELQVTGVVRPQDIEADNTVSHERIAEMRVAYGGRGMLSDLQQPRWGTQVWDIVFPF
jgi:flagellar L-ring protein precursor FlgH